MTRLPCRLRPPLLPQQHCQSGTADRYHIATVVPSDPMSDKMS